MSHTISTSALPPAPRVGVLVWANSIVLAVLTVAFCVYVFPQWWNNPDLSHGLAMPVVVVLLGADVIGRRPGWHPRVNGLLWLACGALALLGFAALGVAGIYAASMEWTHPFVYFTLAIALVSLSAAVALVLASRPIGAVTFNWAAVTILALWLLSVPLPPGSLARLTINLQLWITDHVLGALHLLGIPANQHGNVIVLAQATVGVEEACSGVRSLVSCVFAGLFFSATLVRRPWPRVLLIALAAPLALTMNFLRSLTLTLLANAGVDISGFWHDATGYSVLGITALILGGLALLLGRVSAPPTTPTPPPAVPRSRPRGLLWSLLGVQCAVVALILFFLSGARPPDHNNLPRPDLAALLPATPRGWLVKTETDLQRYSPILRTDAMEQRTYVRPDGDKTIQLTVYLAYWAPGQVPVSLVASHTPDLCWPGAGWEALDRARVTLHLRDQPLPPAEFRRFRNGDFPQNVWFWHLYDGQPINYDPPTDPQSLLKLALHYRFRHGGSQFFVRFSSNQPWAVLAREPLVQEIIHGLQPLGL
ncbi:exosortase-associated EpsI family protein [Horticoccus luteus]|uniref:Exosortase-associated EpsI family protein n=1 Tax=Horticoccus luteus TaxID=2862869 RepID=A0A8F9TTV9_9BACT|nr:exosortase/archaeosortase family protein [Horticoccus luteus]QYM77688.1 exosortase-associated EpsI family protein [Horticoccus luteus]